MLIPINIRPALNGFIVDIGCQTIVYTDREKLVTDLLAYLKDPEKTEKRFMQEEAYNKDQIKVLNCTPDQAAPISWSSTLRAPTNRVPERITRLDQP